MPVVKISSKGQIVIPVEIRRKLDIKPGQMVRLTLEGEKAVITTLPQDPIKALRGALKGKPSLRIGMRNGKGKSLHRNGRSGVQESEAPYKHRVAFLIVLRISREAGISRPLPEHRFILFEL